MSEIGDAFKAIKERNKLKKLSNMEYSTELLKSLGIEFESKNNGVHLIVSHNGLIADFWPSTGKYSLRDGRYKRGVKSLVSDLGVKIK